MTCARTLFWKADNWLRPAVMLPRSKEEYAALKVASNGCLFRLARLASSTHSIN